MIPTFHLQLNDKIERGQATLGQFDGQHTSLACATLAGKVFIHTPHQQSVSDSNISYLNINKRITALTAGNLAPIRTDAKDVLLVGTSTSLQCYDVDSNKDLFFKDLSDGASAIVVGGFGQTDKPMAFVGGNCSLQGFDAKGNENFWTVTGDNVSTMIFADLDGDGRKELLVGTDDCDLRVYRNEDAVAETSESDRFVALCSLDLSFYGYGLVNGTIGVYDQMERIWRVKSKHSVCSIASYDLDGDGVPEMICGWSSGRVEVRNRDTGALAHRDNLGSPISAILTGDYRGDGKQELIVCGQQGEVRGYLTPDPDEPYSAHASLEAELALQATSIAELMQRKQELAYELSSYQNAKDAEVQARTAGDLIPNDTRVDAVVATDKQAALCNLVLTTNHEEAIIKGVVVFGEQIFEEESLFHYPQALSNQACIPLRPTKDITVVLMLKALVGTRSSTSFHVFELEIELPKFAMYAAVEPNALPTPESNVTMMLNERMPRFTNWIESRFQTAIIGNSPEGVKASFLCLRSRLPLVIKAAVVSRSLQVSICVDDIDVAAEIVSEMAAGFNLPNLSTTAHFPTLMDKLKDLLAKVEEHNQSRMHLSAATADTSNLIKTSLIKAEDFRILGAMPSMRKHYRLLRNLNMAMVADHQKRATNQAELLRSLKEVNQIIQQASRVRVGTFKSQVVQACRAAIKAENMALLHRVIRDGHGPANQQQKAAADKAAKERL